MGGAMFFQTYASVRKVLISEIYFPALHRVLSCQWDTGSRQTCIRNAKVSGIKHKRITEVGTVGGKVGAVVYDMDIAIDPEKPPLKFEALGVPEIHGADCLIGMDIISRGNLSITNTDTTTTLRFELL